MTDVLNTTPYQADERTVRATEVAIRDSGTLVLPNDGIPTQVANPRRTSWRTFTQALLPTLLLFNAALLALQGVLAQPDYSGYVPSWAWAVLNGGILISALLSKAIAQVMAVPGVNEWIKTYLPSLAPIPLQTPVETIRE